MNTDLQAADVFHEAVNVAMRLSAPPLLLCLLVGVTVAILQAVTQIHEQSISFVMKMIVVISLLLIGGDWMLQTLVEFAMRMFELMT